MALQLHARSQATSSRVI